MKAHRILLALNRSQNTKDSAMKSWTPLSNICALKFFSYSWFQSIELRDDPIMRLYVLEIWQCDNHQSASMKKRISDHKEKTKPDQKQKWGAVWTTATVICMSRDLQQQHIWYWPPTTTSLLTSSALGNGWRFNIDQCTEFLSVSLKLRRKRIDKEMMNS
jgi:hypothetical protein